MDVIIDELPAILEAFWRTVRLALFGGFGSLVLGTILVAFRVSPVPVLRVIGTVIVVGVRNIPLTLVMFFALFVVSYRLQVQLSDDLNGNVFWFAVIALVVYTSSFICEALRSGINTVPQGQAEAARAIGLGFTQTLRLVILPQAARAAIAPMGSALIAMTKNTTVAATIGAVEASVQMREMIETNGNVALLIFAVFAFGFMCLTIPMGLLTSWASTKWAVAR